MVSELLFYELLLLALLGLVVLSYWAWPRGYTTTDSAEHEPAKRTSDAPKT